MVLAHSQFIHLKNILTLIPIKVKKIFIKDSRIICVVSDFIPSACGRLCTYHQVGRSVMFQLAPASLLSTLIVQCLAYNTVNVYFSPSNIVSSSLAPFVGLEAFETYGDLVPQAIVGEPYPFISPAGNEKRDVLMISVDEEEESFKKGKLNKI